MVMTSSFVAESPIKSHNIRSVAPLEEVMNVVGDEQTSTTSSQMSMALALRSTKWSVSPKIEQNIYWFFEGLEIELRWAHDRSSTEVQTIFIQQTLMPTLQKAKEYLAHIIVNARCIKKLILNVQISDSTSLDVLLEELIGKDNVRLEELLVRRRYVGQTIPAIIKLIETNAHTLRIIGKVGLGEVITAFSEAFKNGQQQNFHLERLSLFNFDLVEKDIEMDAPELAQKTRFFVLRLAGLGRQGLNFDHLSYSAYSGFEITKMPALHMLKHCKVKSLRLTMQSGVAISDPLHIEPLLPELRNLELVGNFAVNSNNMSKLFPKLEQFIYQEQDLVTGLIQRARVLSQIVPDFLHEANAAPLAAAC